MYANQVIIECVELCLQLGIINWYEIGSGFRPGDPGYHGSHRAQDFPGQRQDALAGWALSNRNYFLEVIHDSGTKRYGVKYGAINPGWYSGLWGSGSSGGRDNGHVLHVHLAADIGPITALRDKLRAQLSAQKPLVPTIWIE